MHLNSHVKGIIFYQKKQRILSWKIKQNFEKKKGKKKKKNMPRVYN